jgi:hypothetical protein
LKEADWDRGGTSAQCVLRATPRNGLKTRTKQQITQSAPGPGPPRPSPQSAQPGPHTAKAGQGGCRTWSRPATTRHDMALSETHPLTCRAKNGSSDASLQISDLLPPVSTLSKTHVLTGPSAVSMQPLTTAVAPMPACSCRLQQSYQCQQLVLKLTCPSLSKSGGDGRMLVR